jgi:hypothetical protein
MFQVYVSYFSVAHWMPDDYIKVDHSYVTYTLKYYKNLPDLKNILSE